MKRGADARTEIDASIGVQYIFVRFRAGPKKRNDLQPSYGYLKRRDLFCRCEEQIIILYFFKRYLMYDVREYIKEEDWTLLKNMDEV